MTGDGNRIFGRSAAVELVRGFMERPPDGEFHPALIFEGMPGSGKSALLGGVESLLWQHVPFAHLDFATSQNADIPHVLAHIGFELGRQCPNYGRMQFPRLAIGLGVMDLQLDLRDREQALGEVSAMLKERRKFSEVQRILSDFSSRAIGETAGATISGLGGQDATVAGGLLGLATAQAVEGAAAHLLNSRIPLNRYLGWYGHRDQGIETADPRDTLIDLGHWSANADEENNRARIDDLLCAAFLADVRGAFSHGRRSRTWALNCVALLDNADTAIGTELLHKLHQAHRRTEGVAAATPITVVATSYGELLDRELPDDIDDLDPHEHAHADRHDRRGPTRWARYRLPDLEKEDIDAMLLDIGLHRHTDRRFSRLIHEFTGGHPGAARLVLDTAGMHASKPPGLGELMEQRHPRSAHDEPSPTLAERLCACLLADPASDSRIEDLITCAAARSSTDAMRLAIASGLVSEPHAESDLIGSVDLWQAEGGGGQELLRRLLLYRLATRAPTAKADWATVHDWLRARSRGIGDTVGELYYALAEGDLEFVARQLAQRLPEDGGAPWPALVRDVTAAPNDHPPQHRENPDVRLRELTRPWADAENGRLATVARLTAALWIAADPLSGPERRFLHQRIAADYRRIAHDSPHVPVELLHEADLHERTARLWS